MQTSFCQALSRSASVSCFNKNHKCIISGGTYVPHTSGVVSYSLECTVYVQLFEYKFSVHCCSHCNSVCCFGLQPHVCLLCLLYSVLHCGTLSAKGVHDVQGPSSSPVTPEVNMSHPAKKARNGKEDDTVLMAFASLMKSHQRLPQTLLLHRLADDDEDCSVQVLHAGPFTKYIVLSKRLPASAESCLKVGDLLTALFESILATLHKLSAGRVSVLAVDVHISRDHQTSHTICYCRDYNI